MDQVVSQQMTRSYLVLRIEIGGDDAELVAPNGERYDVIVTPDGGLALVKVGSAGNDTIANDPRTELEGR